MNSSRGGTEVTAFVVLCVVVLAVLAVGALRFAATSPIHDSAASVPSTASGSPAGRHAAAVEESVRLARALIVDHNLTGLSAAVAVGGEIVWSEGFGWSDAESRTPLTPSTRFRLGALSKPLTAFAAALLHDQGRLDLDAPVQRYVRAYPQKQWPVTTRQLLSDIAGVHRIRGDHNDAMPVDHCTNVDEAVAMLVDDPLLFEPGTQHRYSIWGWVLVSAVIDGASDQPFDRFMARQVFEPLGMTRTVVAENEHLDDVAHRGRRPDYSCVAGGGAFLSTPTDLVRLGSAMVKPGLLKPETIAAFHTPGTLASGASTTYALGWTVKDGQLAGKPVRIVSHRGSPAGGTVSLLTFPELGIAIAAASNVTDAKGVDPFALQLAEVFARGR